MYGTNTDPVETQDVRGKDGMGKKTMFSARELEVVEHLKTVDIAEAAARMKIQRGTVDAMLTRIKNKIELARDTSNHSANWLDGAKYPRLAKILRRQDYKNKRSG